MRADGSSLDFEPAQYTRYIGEHVEPWSHGKFPYAKGWGEDFSMNPRSPRGIYRANSLARLNVCDFIRTPLAQEELEEFRARFGRPVQSVMLNHWARLIGLLHASERVVELLDHPDITDPLVRNSATARAGHAVGCIEAPRGTLIHEYATDANGFITRANLIVGTTHNLAPINMSVKKAACRLIAKGVVDEALLNRIEMVVRAYDPCFSCATHALDGKPDLEVIIRDSDGRELAVDRH
jgi:F420-non-reducing hydrogenase large subunit